MEGWIKLHREIQNHWIWNDEVYFKAWIAILLTVNHKDKKVLIQGELIGCKRGQSLLSLQGWSKCFGKKWTIQRVRTFFKLLKYDGMITVEGLRKTTRVTICNYELYQFDQQTNNTQLTSKQHAANNKQEGIERIKNEKKQNIYNDFYDSEIQKSEQNENYIKVVKILFGENNLGIPLTSVLNMKTQLSFSQFKTIWYLKEKYKISITEILEQMENWIELKNRKTIYSTFLTFAKKRNPLIETK
jgi:hypothetical protein